MLYTELTKKALLFAWEAHEGQKDKSGMPYIFHPYEVALRQTEEYCVCAALLHDVIEDTALTAEELAKEFPAEVVEAVVLLTHPEGELYLDYVRRIAKNPIAAAVKRGDLAHNSDTTRLDTVDEKALQRVEKYRQALRILNGEEE